MSSQDLELESESESVLSSAARLPAMRDASPEAEASELEELVEAIDVDVGDVDVVVQVDIDDDQLDEEDQLVEEEDQEVEVVDQVVETAAAAVAAWVPVE